MLIKGESYRYAVPVEGERFVIVATGVGEQAGDVWHSDDEGRTASTTPLCAGMP